jgi:hypothetical protein
MRKNVALVLVVTGIAIFTGCEALRPSPGVEDIPITASCSRPPVYGVYAGRDGNPISADTMLGTNKPQ